MAYISKLFNFGTITIGGILFKASKGFNECNELPCGSFRRYVSFRSYISFIIGITLGPVTLVYSWIRVLSIATEIYYITIS